MFLMNYYTIIALCYGALKSHIDQGRRPRSILLFSAPQHIILHKMKYCNCFITFSIPSIYFVYLDQFLWIVCCYLFSNSKTQELIHLISQMLVLIQCVHIYITNAMCTNLYLHSACICKTSVPLSVCVCVTSLQRTQKMIGWKIKKFCRDFADR